MKRPSGSIPTDIEFFKQEIRETEEIISLTNDPHLKPILDQLLIEQKRHLLELEQRWENPRTL